jgi:hypothetical protein
MKAGVVGLKPTTVRVEAGCSIQLSYTPTKADNEHRTRAKSLEDSHATNYTISAFLVKPLVKFSKCIKTEKTTLLNLPQNRLLGNSKSANIWATIDGSFLNTPHPQAPNTKASQPLSAAKLNNLLPRTRSTSGILLTQIVKNQLTQVFSLMPLVELESTTSSV